MLLEVYIIISLYFEVWNFQNSKKHMNIVFSTTYWIIGNEYLLFFLHSVGYEQNQS